MLDALLEVVRAIAAATDSRRVVTALAQGACTITAAPVAIVALATPSAAPSAVGDRPRGSRSPGAGYSPADASSAGRPSATTEAAVGLPDPLPAPPPAVERALTERRAIVVDDLRLAGAPEVRHASVVPLADDGRTLGAVLVAARTFLAATEARALEILVAHAALALAHTDAHTAAARRLARSEEHVLALGRLADATTPGAVVAPADASPAPCAELVVEAFARGLPSVWLFQERASTGPLTCLAHAGASAAGAHVPEAAARAAIAAATVVHHGQAGAPALVAAPLPGARPPAALVLAPLPALVPAPRPGTLHIELSRPSLASVGRAELAVGAAAHLATVLRC